MKASRICLGFAAVLAVIGLVAVPAAAHADTYQILDLDGVNFNGATIDVIGITASGAVVLVENIPPGAPLCLISNICQEYETWMDGVMVNESTTAPDLVYDNGALCTVSAPFLTPTFPFPVQGICNNGHEVYSAPSDAAPYAGDNFTGPDPVADLFASPPTEIEDFDLNSSGDFVYTAYHHAEGGGPEAIFEAIDTSETPEPASIFLLGTGLVAVAGSLRRRLFACSH